jgi:hypothetical protein
VKGRKINKKVVVGAVAAAGLCTAMVAGTTLAWFKDEVVTSGTIIDSGDFEVSFKFKGLKNEASDYAAKTGIALDTEDFATVTEAPLFEIDLWEPGYSAVRVFKIENEGELAAAYSINFIEGQSDTATVNDSEQQYYLTDAIDVYTYVSSDEPHIPNSLEDVTKKASGYVKLGNLTQVMGESGIATGTLLPTNPDAVQYVTMVLNMPTSIEKEYADLSGNLELAFNAIQVSYEEDDFGNTYDEDAAIQELLGYTKASTEAEFYQAIENAGTIAKIALTEDVTLTQTLSMNKNLFIKGNGHTITVENATDNLIYTNYDTVHLENVKLVGNGSTNGIMIGIGSKVSMENVEISGVKNGIYVFKSPVDEMAIKYLKNVTIDATEVGIKIEGGGAELIENCNVTAPTAVSLNGHYEGWYNADATFKGGYYNGDWKIGIKWQVLETKINLTLDNIKMPSGYIYFYEGIYGTNLIETSVQNGELVEAGEIGALKQYVFK